MTHRLPAVCVLLLALAPCLMAQSNWFLPYEPDDATVLLLRLDEESGPARDASKTGCEAELLRGATRGEGRFGKGIALSGPKQTLSVAASDALLFRQNDPFTVELWVKPESTDTASLFSIRTRFYLKGQFRRRIVSFGYRAASFPIRWFHITEARLPRGRWTHLAVTHSADRGVRLYLNGRFVGEIVHKDEGDYAKPGPCFFGSHDGWTAFLEGHIDEVRVSRTVREFRPLLLHRYYLRGEKVRLCVDTSRLPVSVARTLVLLKRGSKTLGERTLSREEIGQPIFDAESLPERDGRVVVRFLDRDGKTISQLTEQVAFVGPRQERILAELNELSRRLAKVRDANLAMAKVVEMYADRVRAEVSARRFDEAQGRLGAAARIVAALENGEAAYRRRLREIVRAHPARNRVRVTMSWRETAGEARDAFPWAKRIGANELVTTIDSASREWLASWKNAGFHTAMLGSLPVHLGKWVHDHPEHAQSGYWATSPVTAKGDTLTIQIKSPTWGHITLNDRADPKQSWKVMDLTSGQPAPSSAWECKPPYKVLTLRGAQKGHRYQVFFAIANTSVGNMLHEEFAAASLAELDRTLKPLAGVLDTYWFDDLGFAYPGPTPQRTWDWESYTLVASPRVQRWFTRDTGIAFDPVWLAMPPRTIEVVPKREYIAWMRWVQAKMKPWLARAAAVPHKYGMRAWLYWGDCDVGIEPFLGSLTGGRIDEVDKPTGDPVTARALVDFPGDVYRRMRVEWLHAHIMGSATAPGRFLKQWGRAKRGLLMRPIRGLYWMPFPNVARALDPAVREDLVETIAAISDEFRLIAEQLAGHRAYTHPITVYVLTSWGAQYSWRPWGAAVLAPLTNLPVRVKFISFLDVERDGIPSDASVILNYGGPNSAWSGGRFWRSPQVIDAITSFVKGGGGLVGIQAPSYCESPKPHWALASLYGVEGSGTAAYKPAAFDESMLADSGLAAAEGQKPTATMVRTKQGQTHWITRQLEDVALDVSGATEAAPVEKDVSVLFLLRQGGKLSVGVSAQQVSKGRAVYVCGRSSAAAYDELIRRAIFWAARKENMEVGLKATGAGPVYVYAYPTAHKLALLNLNGQPVRAHVRAASSVLGLKPNDRCRLTDVVTGETLFDGPASRLGEGFDVDVCPNAVRILAATPLASSRRVR